jgi:iron complex outermembrane receptor protein
MRTRTRHGLSLAISGLSGLVLSLASSPSGAQTSSNETADSSGALTEIVVTARFKKENLQAAPVAITAITSQEIEARGSVDIMQIANTVPNVEMQQNNSVYGRAATAYIRGVGQNDFNYALEPGVAFYVDGVYYGTLLGDSLGLLDTDNVQVLRGPQGTLFGKNSEGGAISITSVKPKGDGSGYVEAGIGSYERRYYKGAFDVSVIDNELYLRVAGASDRYDGYQTRNDYFCVNPSTTTTLSASAVAPNCSLGTLGGNSTQTARAALRYIPSSTVEMNVSADVTTGRGEPTPNTTLAITGVGAPANAAPPWISLLTGYGINPALLVGGSHPYSNYQGFAAPAVGNSLPPINNMNEWGTVGTFDWDASDAVHVKSITGYRWYSMDWSAMQGGGPILLAGINNQVEHNQTSQELQVSGHALDNALDWTGGAYYYHGYSYNGGYVDVDFAHFGFSQANDSKLTDKSVFAHVDYKVGDVGIEAGLRYTKENKSVTINEFVLPISAGIPFVPPDTGTTDLSRVDPKIGVRYNFTPDLMVYADYSTGFKSGGINPRPTSPATTGIPFGAEKVQAYEVGFKSEWLNHTLRSNTALFLSNYDDFQIQGETGSGNFILIVETAIGKARIYGVEEELQWEPLKGLNVNLSGGWLEFNTLSLGSSSNCNCGGPGLDTQPPGVPKVTANAGLQYELPIGSSGSLTPRLDYNYKSLVWNDSPNSSPTNASSPSPFPNATPAIGLLDAQLTWRSTPQGTDGRGDWSVRAQVKNVTNKFYYQNTLLQPWTLDGVPSLPRTWSVMVTRRF